MSSHFKIVVPFYNVERWIKATINSIVAQDYENYECVLIDDLSTDKSYEIAKICIDGDPRFKILSNKSKMYALGNTAQGIEFLKPDPEDVLMVLDGDDWFSNQSVLSRLNLEYEDDSCWMTYGSYVEYPAGVRGKFPRQIPAHVIKSNSFREYPWCSSQLRTFKAFLWNNIDRNDFLSKDGMVYHMTGDLAHIFPMLEMAGTHSRFIQDILYVYNLETSLNDHKKNNPLQMQLEQEIRAKSKYLPRTKNELL